MTTEHAKDTVLLDGLGFKNNPSEVPSFNFLMIAIGSLGAASPPTR
jgi:hypothetical protein